MKVTLAIAAGAMALLFVVGVDVLHCVLIGAVVITVGLLATSMDAVEMFPEPDPLPIPYATTLLRSLTFSNPRSTDPIGDTAARGAVQVYDQAMIDFPGDPVLVRHADRPANEWRFLGQRDLVTILDRVDQLESARAAGGRALVSTPIPESEETR